MHQSVNQSRHAVRRYVLRLKRVPKPVPVRSPLRLRLSLVEREEISRGLASGESLRAIAARLGRVPSTVSREVSAHGGRRRYRALPADRAAVRQMRRTDAGEARDVCAITPGGGVETASTLVCAGDLGLAGARVSVRSGDAR